MPPMWGGQSWLPPAFSRRLDTVESVSAGKIACPAEWRSHNQNGCFRSRTMFVEQTHINRKGKTPMNDFIARFQDQLSGTLSGFDRLVFLGTLWRNRITGLKGYLWAHNLGAK